MSKYSTCPTFLEFERLFGATAADDLVQRIVETQINEGDRGGNGISLNVEERSIGFYTVSGYLDYAGQEMTFELNWGHGHGTDILVFDFNAAQVRAQRHQMMWDATRDTAMGNMLHSLLRHAQPVLALSHLELTPNRAPARLNIELDNQRAAVCVPGVIHDAGAGISYPGIAQCELAFQGEECVLTVGLAALHPDDDDDLVELMHWASAFSAVPLLSQTFKLNSEGLLDVSSAAIKLGHAVVEMDSVGALEGFSPLGTLEHQFANSLLEACAP